MTEQRKVTSHDLPAYLGSAEVTPFAARDSRILAAASMYPEMASGAAWVSETNLVAKCIVSCSSPSSRPVFYRGFTPVVVLCIASRYISNSGMNVDDCIVARFGGWMCCACLVARMTAGSAPHYRARVACAVFLSVRAVGCAYGLRCVSLLSPWKLLSSLTCPARAPSHCSGCSSISMRS